MAITVERKQQVYDEGCNAHYSGVSRGNCPYRPSAGGLSVHWCKGWDHAEATAQRHAAESELVPLSPDYFLDKGKPDPLCDDQGCSVHYALASGDPDPLQIGADERRYLVPMGGGKTVIAAFIPAARKRVRRGRGSRRMGRAQKFFYAMGQRDALRNEYRSYFGGALPETMALGHRYAYKGGWQDAWNAQARIEQGAGK